MTETISEAELQALKNLEKEYGELSVGGCGCCSEQDLSDLINDYIKNKESK